MGQLCPECVAQRGGQRVISSADMRRQAARSTPVTYSLLGLCVAVFAVVALAPDAASVIFVRGAQLNSEIAAGQWYRLLTAAFLHLQMPHILFNMLALYVLGPQLERQVGSVPFLGLYLSSAVVGGAAFYLLNDPFASAIGASGAIFGLFGAWLAVAFRSRHTTWGRAGFRQMLTLLAINMALPLVMPNIAWEAHLGGLGAGALIASVWMMAILRGRSGARTAVAGAVGLAALGLVLL